MEEHTKKRVAYYIRVSTEEQAEMYGMEMQRKALDGLVASKGEEYEFAGEDYVYMDDISGSTEPTQRDGFKKLMEDLAYSDVKPFDIVAVYKIDRFARRLKVLLEILDIFNTETYKVEFISAHESIDTSTPFGRAMLGIMGVIAELELENIKLRTQNGRAEAAASGVFLNTPPLGYIKNNVVPNEGKILIEKEEAKIVRMIFNMYVNDRMSTTEIAKYLREHRVKTPQAYRFEHNKEKEGRAVSKGGIHHWYPQSVKEILKNELYIGIQYYDKTVNKKKVPKDQWKIYYHNQAILDTSENGIFYQAQRITEQSGNRYYTKRDDNRRYLLQGLLRCANCFDPEHHTEPYTWHGVPHRVKSNNSKVYYYECSSKHSTKKEMRKIDCRTIPIPALNLEEYVLDQIFKLIKNPDVVFKYQQNLQSKKYNIRHLNDKLSLTTKLLNGYEASRRNIIDMFENKDITKAEKDEKMAKLNEDKARYLKEKTVIEEELSVFTNQDEYIKVLEIFKEKYDELIKSYTSEEDSNTEELYRIVHQIVDRIIVFSRPKRKSDSVSGPKKEGQMIPYMLKLELKIPSEMLYDLLSTLSPEEKFQAEERGWWAI